MKSMLVLVLGAAALGARAEVAYLNGSDSIGYSSMTNADGSVTFAAKLDKGLMLIVR